MSIDPTRDASQLLEDIELELASIRAATALRSLDRPASPPLKPPAPMQALAPRVIDASGRDLEKVGRAAPVELPADPAPAATSPDEPKRRSLRERLASIARSD